MTTTLPKNYTSRHAKMDDVQAAVDLGNACSIELVGEPECDLHHFRTDWESDALDPGNDLRVVFAPDGKMVGYAGVWDESPHVQPHGWANVHPDYKGRGIGTHLAQWVEQRARQAIPKAPEGARVALGQSRFSTDTVGCVVLEQQGYQVVRHGFLMHIDLDEDSLPPEPVFPPGITIGSLDMETQFKDLVQALDEMFQDHWGIVKRSPEENSKSLVQWIKSVPDFDPALWFLAMDGDEIAGSSLCLLTAVESPDMGYVENVGVIRRWRRQGVALGLLHYCFRELYSRGKRQARLGVDAQSLTGATRLYEKAGMRVHRQDVSYEKELRPGKELRTESL